MIMVERFGSINLKIFVILIDEIILLSEHIMTEIVERDGNIIPFIKSFDNFIGFLLSF